MIVGPSVIKKCSNCSKQVAQWGFVSGNTFGAKFWTDGKMDAPMFGETLDLVKCPHCNETFWFSELPKFRSAQPTEEEGFGLGGAMMHLEPTLNDYVDVLATRTLSPAKERYVRMRLWWAGNDRRRSINYDDRMRMLEILTALGDAEKKQLDGPDSDLSRHVSELEAEREEIIKVRREMSQVEIENLSALAELLDELDPKDLVLKAEALRELGHFATALCLLEKSTEPGLSKATDVIADLANKGDRLVREMK